MYSLFAALKLVANLCKLIINLWTFSCRFCQLLFNMNKILSLIPFSRNYHAYKIVGYNKPPKKSKQISSKMNFQYRTEVFIG